LFTTASLSVNVTLYKKTIAFDPVKDLVPVSWISSVPLLRGISSEGGRVKGEGRIERSALAPRLESDTYDT